MNANSQVIKILILEDNEIDKKIIYSTIEHSELNCATLIVDTKKGFVDALNGFKPDVVLSDYVLPDFDGKQALALHLQFLPDTPFIFVTGQLSEETTIELLKLGAWDYIMKDHIKRLPVSIKNVLDLHIERKANKEKEQRIGESEKRYKSLSELTFEGILIHKNGVVKDCNLSYCRMYGYQREELLETNFIEKLIHPDSQQAVIDNISKGETSQYEAKGVRKDGSVFPVEQEGKAIIYNGELVRVVAIRDITSRKEALAEIKLSEEKFQKISNAAKDAIVLIDNHGNVSFWNMAATDLFQYSKEEIFGKNFHNIIAPQKYHEAHGKGFEQFLINGEGPAVGKILELEALRKDGVEIPVELSLSSINIHGKWNAVGIIRDISIRKKAEAEMLAAQQYAREMSIMKSNFLSTMSHELRTPLNGILGFSEILLESLENPEYRNWAQTIYKSSERILNTFNLIIDLAVLDANKVTVNKKPENILEIIQEVFDSYESEAKEKGLYLKQDINLIEANAEIDLVLLTQALNNLLNNAIKYTEKGGITISLNKLMVNGVDCFELIVSDTGIGIPADKSSLIYLAFRQVSEGYNRSFEGMGLGLYITKKYIDLLDGFIDMESEVGTGTKFILYFPLKGKDKVTNLNKNRPLIPPVKSPPENGIFSILYVEDDASHRQFVKLFLKGMYDLLCVENAAKALEAATSKQFDIILMDINLGTGMNGLDVVEKLREMPEYKATPIVAVTANALISQKNEYLAKGCSHYIAKPFRKQKLIDFISNILEGY
ncbi:MAG: PAS domain S-box protein [Bacteroidales bacterium]|nr:PAS domain S-box protein [Bacteroidales bacterium]